MFAPLVVLCDEDDGRGYSMILNASFEIVDIVDEHVAVPVGEEASSFGGVIALTEAACFLLKNLSTPKTKEELLDLLIAEFDVDRATAEKDIDEFIRSSLEIGLIEK